MKMDRYKVLVGGEIKDSIDRYTSSFEFDKSIAKYVAQVMLVHVISLSKKNIIENDLARVISRELLDIMNSDGEKLYRWAKEKGKIYEDIFEALELYLYEAVGPGAGSIAIGRSRNDHIATVLRLVLRDRALSISSKILKLRKTLIDKAIEYRETTFPFYTHAQLAQCGSASLYFLTYEQSLADIFQMFKLSLNFLNQNPLGSGASAGTTVPIDLDLVSRDLCLKLDPIPPYYSTGSRLFLLYFLSVLTLLMSEIGRLIEDIMLFVNVLQQGIEVPRHHISTSSIMPHKRNLVTLEIARAKVSKALGSFTASISIYKSLPYGYNLDFQELNIIVFDILRDIEETLDIVNDFLTGLRLNDEDIKRYLEGKPCWSSDLIEYIAISTGKPVRELYAKLAKVLQQYLSGNKESLKNFLAEYGLGEHTLNSIHKLRPIEKVLQSILGYSIKRFNDDKNEVEQVDVYLKSCNEMLIRDALQV